MADVSEQLDTKQMVRRIVEGLPTFECKELLRILKDEGRTFMVELEKAVARKK